MTNRAVIIGAGGFGREVRDWFLEWAGGERTVGNVWEFAGFLDDGQPDTERLGRIDAEHLGPVDAIETMPDAVYYVAVGDPATRARIVDQLTALGAKPGPAIIHPTAIVGSDVEIGDGSVICPLVAITTNVRIGEHVHLNLTSTVGHDTVLEDYVTVNPGATISGDVTLAEGVMVGTGASVNQGLRVGRGSVIGAGAAAVKDIPDGVVAVGVPAKPRG